MKRYPTVTACAAAYVSANFTSHPHSAAPSADYASCGLPTGYASNLSFVGATAYSFGTPIPRVPYHAAPGGAHPPLLLIDKHYEYYSQTTARHIRVLRAVFHTPLYGGNAGKVISVYNLTDPLGTDALTQMVGEVDTLLHAACNTRKRIPTRIQCLTDAEARLQDVSYLTDVFDAFDSLIPPALSRHIYATHQLFQNIPTRSHPCALFSTHTQATVDSITTLLAIRALEA